MGRSLRELVRGVSAAATPAPPAPAVPARRKPIMAQNPGPNSILTQRAMAGPMRPAVATPGQLTGKMTPPINTPGQLGPKRPLRRMF